LFGGYDMYDKISRETAAKLFQYKLEILHRTELQRVDRSAGAWKVENRVPFLDKTVVETALMLEQCHKIKDGVEKWCVRKAFEDYLPEYILYRKKNPLSHSSGLHEKVRIKKILFKKYYNSFKFDRHDKMRRDFSITLQSNNYNIEKSVTEQEIYIDYSLKHKLLETVKGFIRFYFMAPSRKAEKRCISGNL
jgi:asparagine synthase (glutamine-hydrolysing)